MKISYDEMVMMNFLQEVVSSNVTIIVSECRDSCLLSKDEGKDG